MAQPIEIFRAGTHRPTNGSSLTVSTKDLDDVVAAYDPKRHEAPLVIGHPKEADPAYGWVEKLFRKGASLFAVPKQLEPTFAEAVKAGRYKKVSASFYMPSSSANPTPGKLALRHVGFLGAQPPAVKGLTAVSFSDKGAEAVSFELSFAEVDEEAVLKAIASALPGAVATAIDALAGTLPAESALPAEALEAAKTGMVEAVTQVVSAALEAGRGATTTDAPTSDLAEGEELISAARGLLPDVVEAALPAEVPTRDDVKGALVEQIMKALAAALEQARGNAQASSDASADLAEHRARRERLDARERALAERESKQRRVEHVSFLEQLVSQGRPLPCARDIVLSFMELLERSKPDVVSFGESEKRAPIDIFKTELLAKLPKQVHFPELTRADPDADFAEGEDAEAIGKRARAYFDEQIAKGNRISTADAVRHVRKHKGA